MIRLGEYDLVRPAGSGGAAVVWEGFHRASATPVAVKVLGADVVHDDVLLRSFRTEVRAAARLDHPHVIRVYDHGRLPDRLPVEAPGLVGGAPYTVMEWVGGGALQPASVTGWEEAADLAMALLSALAHAHARGVIHRDLKPGNVLIAAPGDRRPGPRLTDFGGSLRRSQRPGAAPNLGTPAYLPPERLREAWWEEGPGSDLYALGCLLWRVLTGGLPHGGRAAEEIMLARLRGVFVPFRPRFPVPPGIEGWLQRLCASAVERRYPLAADAMHALLRAGGEPPARPDRARTELELLIAAAAAERAPDEALPPVPAAWDLGLPPQPVDDLLLGKLELRPLPLVDRRAERTALWQALHQVRREGRPRAVLLVGPTGFGRSALARWLGEHAEALGAAEVLHATHGAQPGPHDGLGPMLARWLRVQGLDRDAALPAIEARLASHRLDHTDNALAVAELVGAPGRAEGRLRFSHPEERHHRLGDILAGLAQARPVVLILDDVQWGSEARAFLRRLLDAPGVAAPILVVATWSTDRAGDHPDAGETLRALGSTPGAQVLAVGPLPAEAMDQLLLDELGLRGELAARIAERAGGSPAYVLQLVESWVHRGLLRPSPEGLHLAEGQAVALPRGAREVWLERLAPFLAAWPEQAGEALEVAAVLGQEVGVATWRAACTALGLDAPAGLLEQLADAGLVLVEGSAGWCFAHPMLRDALVERARAAGREPRLHQACARVLADRPEASGRLGRHLLEGGDPAGALAPLCAAAEAAMDLGEYARAEVLLHERDRALREAGLPEGDARHGEGWLAWCRLLRARGGDEQVRHLATRTVDAGERHGWPRLVAQALVYLGRSELRAGRTGRAWRRLVEAARLAAAEGDAALEADALRAQGLILAQRGQLERADRRIRAALARVEADEQPMRLAGTLLDLAYVARQRERLDEAARLAARALGLYEQLGSRWGVANALNLEGELARQRGDPEAAVARYELALRRAAAVGSGLTVIPRVNLALARIAAGRPEQARPGLLAILADPGTEQQPALRGTVHAGLCACAAAAGDWSGMQHHLAVVEELLATVGYHDRDIPAVLQDAAALARAAGRPVEARQALAVGARQLLGLGDEAAAARILAVPGGGGAGGGASDG